MVDKEKSLLFVIVNNLSNEKMDLLVVLRNEILHDFNSGSNTVYIAHYPHGLFVLTPYQAFIASAVIYES